jgi:hypothetical protein
MPGRSHLNLFKKDTHDLFMLCIIFMCQLIMHYLLLLLVIYRCRSFILFVVWSSFVLCSTFVSCWKEKIRFWSWIVFQVFWSCCTCCTWIPSLSMQVNKHHTSDCTDFVLALEWVAYYDHRHSRIDETIILQVVKAVEGETITTVI